MQREVRKVGSRVGRESGVEAESAYDFKGG